MIKQGNKMKVLSLFDGISCGQVALKRAGFNIDYYMASEINKSAIAVAQYNHPETIQMGDVTFVSSLVNADLLGDIDLLIGGSPCQGFSNAGHGKGFEDPRSKLLFEYISIKNYLKPKYWLLENVKMKKIDCDLVSMMLGVQPIEINSSLFSAQNRSRLYWTNIPINPIIDKKIPFWSIREWSGDHLKQYKLNKTPSREKMWSNGLGKKSGFNGVCVNVSYADKTSTLTTKQDRCPNAGLIEFEDFARFLTHNECERLQTLPDDYTKIASSIERYAQLGNGWTVDVVAHIFEGMRG